MGYLKMWIIAAVLLVGLSGTETAQAKKEVLAGPITGEVLQVLDGDTMDVDIQVWLDQRVKTKLRIDGIDTPELRGKCESEKAKAKQAREEVKRLVKAGRVAIYNIRQDKYGGRVLGKVHTLEGVDIGEHMISKGLARPYHGEKRGGWCGA